MDETEDDDERIARALERLEDAVARKPGFGRSTATSTTTLAGGLRCVTREAGHVIETDLVEALGGTGTGPSPSAVVRAALGSCLAMGYRLRAARHRVPVDSIRVEVVTESAVSGMLDPDSTLPPGFLDIRCHVEIDSPAAADRLERVMAEADRLSPVLDIVSRPNLVDRCRADGSRDITGGER